MQPNPRYSHLRSGVRRIQYVCRTRSLHLFALFAFDQRMGATDPVGFGWLAFCQPYGCDEQQAPSGEDDFHAAGTQVVLDLFRQGSVSDYLVHF